MRLFEHKHGNVFILKEVSIPTYKEPSQFYAGGKNFYKKFRESFPKLPEQVANDIYNQTSPGTNKDIVDKINNGINPRDVFTDYFTGKAFNFIKDPGTNLTSDELEKVLDGDWKMKILTLNPSNFSQHTLDKFIKRDFGRSADNNNPERIKRQQSSAKGDGSNEAVTIIEKNGEYILWEGFHRTMSILALGDNGNDPTKWNNIKIKAWVVKI